MTHKITIVVLLLIASTTCGCLSSHKYVHENNPAEYIELKYNDKFIVHQEDGFAGTWWIHNDALNLQTNFGTVITMPANGSAYIDPDGDRWTQK